MLNSMELEICVLFEGGPLDGKEELRFESEFPILYREGHYDHFDAEYEPLETPPGHPFQLAKSDKAVWVEHTEDEYLQLRTDQLILKKYR